MNILVKTNKRFRKKLQFVGRKRFIHKLKNCQALNTSSSLEDICSETYHKGALIDNTNKQNQKLANSVSRVSFGAEFIKISPAGETGHM